MVKAYLDASVLVPIFLKEATSEDVRHWVGTLDLPPVVGTLAIGDAYSAVSRFARMGVIGRLFAESRLNEIDRWCAGRVEVFETEAVDVRVAKLFVRRLELGLRMPDAIHVAVCQRTGLTLATFDTRLARAATALGIDVVVPA